MCLCVGFVGDRVARKCLEYQIRRVSTYLYFEFLVCFVFLWNFGLSHSLGKAVIFLARRQIRKYAKE